MVKCSNQANCEVAEPLSAANSDQPIDPSQYGCNVKPSAQTVTGLLADWGGGDDSAAARIFPLVYEELRRLAHGLFAGLSPDQTLQPTALVHEAYLRLVDQSRPNWTDRAHFMNVAAKAMRRLLVDHLRARRSQKRGGQRDRLPLDDSVLAISGTGFLDALALEEVLERLEALDARKAQVVELRFFGGLNIEEVAKTLGISRATVTDDWHFARSWLAVELGGEEKT